MTHIDLTIQPSIAVEVKAPVLFPCPYCHRGIRSTQRLNYPPAAVGAFAPVYRCLCGKFIGAPMVSAEETTK